MLGSATLSISKSPSSHFMYKQQFVACVARDTNYTVREVTEVFDKAFRVIIDNLNAGEEVNINGLGRFKLKYHKPRIVVNPKTRLKYIREERATVVFAPSNRFQIAGEVVARLAAIQHMMQQ